MHQAKVDNVDRGSRLGDLEQLGVASLQIHLRHCLQPFRNYRLWVMLETCFYLEAKRSLPQILVRHWLRMVYR